MTVEETVADLRVSMARMEATLTAHQAASEARAVTLGERIGATSTRLDKIERTLETWQGALLRIAIGAAVSSGGVSALVSYGVQALSP